MSSKHNQLVSNISLVLDLDDAGNMDICIRAGASGHRMNISYLAAGPAEIMVAVIAFFMLGTSQSVIFELEPGNPVLRFDWVNGRPGLAIGNVRVRIGENVPPVGWENQYQSDTPAEFDITCRPYAFQQAFAGSLIKLIEDIGPDAINEQWSSDPPSQLPVSSAHLSLLKDVLREFPFGPEDQY